MFFYQYKRRRSPLPARSHRVTARSAKSPDLGGANELTHRLCERMERGDVAGEIL